MAGREIGAAVDAREARAAAASFASWLPSRRDVAAVPSFTVRRKAYFVLVGTELSVDPPVVPAVVNGQHRITVSSKSVLGQPFRVAVGCTCKDWEYRSTEAAAAGCKHMMLVNATLLGRRFATLGPSYRASETLEKHKKQPQTTKSNTFEPAGPLTSDGSDDEAFIFPP